MPELLTRGELCGWCLEERPNGRLQIRTLSGFISERRPTSNRNGVRLRVGIPGRIKSESTPSIERRASVTPIVAAGAATSPPGAETTLPGLNHAGWRRCQPSSHFPHRRTRTPDGLSPVSPGTPKAFMKGMTQVTTAPGLVEGAIPIGRSCKIMDGDACHARDASPSPAVSIGRRNT